MVVFVLRRLAEKRRTKMLEQAAAALGFEFVARGRDADTTNVLTGSSDDITIRISDRKWLGTRQGGVGRTYRESRISLTSDLLQMPTFTITHEGAIAKALTATLGMQDIDFDSHPEFSRTYLLQSKNEKECRAFFTGSILEKFNIARGLTVKGSGQTLLVYRSKSRIKPGKLQAAMEEVFEVYGWFSEEPDKKK